MNILKVLTETGSLPIGHFKITFKKLVDGELLPIEAAAFLVALKMKKENAQEIGEAARYLREKAVPVIVQQREMILDTCGTGGAGFNKLNISTAVFFIAAAAGIPVAKHGNRAASGRCGSADVLEAMGIKIDTPPEKMKEVFEKMRMAFLFAPLYHPALKNLAPVRKELGIRTIFNLLGPLCNPYFPTHQVMGVSSKELSLPMAKALSMVRLKRGFVVHCGGLDEASLHDQTELIEIKNSKVLGRRRVSPEDFGLKKVSLRKLEVKNTPAENAGHIQAILDGKEKGPQRDMVLMNAALAVYCTGRSKSFREAAQYAASLIDEGKVTKKIQEFKEAVANA